MKKFTKLASLVLALVMVFSLSINAFAATGDPNFTAAPGTAWSTETTAGTPVTVSAGPASVYYDFTGFTNEADAEAATVSFNYGADLVNSYSTDGVLIASTNTWATAVTITPKANVVGPISVRVASGSAYVDLTVYVERASGNADDVSGVSVEVCDLHGDTYMYEFVGSTTVKAADKEASNPYYDSAACAQTYPTAGDALYALMRTGDISFTQSGGYVDTVSDNYGNSLAGYTNEDWTIYYGWNYCVMRDVDATDGVDYEIVAESAMTSASVMPIQSYDRVYWAFGTVDECNDYFATVAAADDLPA